MPRFHDSRAITKSVPLTVLPIFYNLEPWTDDALCKGLTPEEADNLFFVPKGTNTRTAKAFCRPCPVITECGQFALNHPDDLDGVWGGMNNQERKRLRKLFGTKKEVVVETTAVSISSTTNTDSGTVVSIRR